MSLIEKLFGKKPVQVIELRCRYASKCKDYYNVFLCESCKHNKDAQVSYWRLKVR